MKLKTLQEIIKKKYFKKEFAILTNLKNGETEIFEPGRSLSKEFKNYQNQVENFFKKKKTE